MVRVSFTAGAVWSAILATAGLLVFMVPAHPGSTRQNPTHKTIHATSLQFSGLFPGQSG